MKIAHVGSSIYGDLLKPNDIDIAISTKLFFTIFWNIGKIFNLLPKKHSKNSNKITKDFLGIKISWQERIKPFSWFSMRISKYNFIILKHYSIEDYVRSFDMNILYAYKSLFSKNLILLPEAKRAFQDKTIQQLKRKYNIFEVFYDGCNSSEEGRAKKYRTKIPDGWRFIPL